MPSPFPGMDPYLESPPFWGDLHGTMISVIKADLNQRLPANYSAWSDIYIWLHEPDAETRRGKPDDFITSKNAGASNEGRTVLTAPTTSLLPAVRRRGNRYLKIKEAGSDRVVTVIEFLSPANKAPGDDRDAFLAKRNEYLATGTNVVEIDLLRAGQRMPMGKPKPPRADYYVLVCQAVEFPRIGVWPFSVRDPLPDIPVPLDPEDGFIQLSLKSCFDLAYDQGSYRREVNYARPPRSGLQGQDAAWAAQIAKAQR